MGIVLIEDTRQQASKHIAKHQTFERMGVTLVRSKLAHGDYALPPKVSVDTKQSIIELAADIDNDHARFKRECEGARDAGTQLVVLVENTCGVDSIESLAEWVEPVASFKRRKYAKRRIYGSRLAKACLTMEKRYGVRFEFCTPFESAERVLELLKGGDES